MKGPGRVYKIVCALSDDVYIGSTFQELRHRFQGHKNRSNINKTIDLYKLFDKYGIQNFKIMLIQEYNVNDRRCLLIWETFWIDKLNCINKRLPIDLFNGKCVHRIQKQRCKECNGISVCEHNRQQYLCKECNGTSICVHDKRKSRCKECQGSEICIHNKRKSQCKECGGSQICIHNKQKSNCKDCNNFLCEICDKKYCSKSSLKKHTLKFH